MLVLHGLLGSAANWRSFARRLVAAAPTWGLVLVDQRMHGESQDAPPPHTLDAAAEDLVRLGETLAFPISGVLGHSFGGKVALAYAGRAERAQDLEQVWVIDASPGRRTRASSTDAVLELLRELPSRFESREAFVQAVMAKGQPRGIADWLAMNLRRRDGGLWLRLDLDAVGSLLSSFLEFDLWDVLETARGASTFEIVVAGASDAFDEADRARLAAIARREPRVREHVIPGSGHWVHVDAPDALLDLVSRALA
jgi:pimeloyl-ACP methyl ester carboxylesterase